MFLRFALDQGRLPESELDCAEILHKLERSAESMSAFGRSAGLPTSSSWQDSSSSSASGSADHIDAMRNSPVNLMAAN